jgi:hypothetical protein
VLADASAWSAWCCEFDSSVVLAGERSPAIDVAASVSIVQAREVVVVMTGASSGPLGVCCTVSAADAV